MNNRHKHGNPAIHSLLSFFIAALCFALAGCTISLPFGGSNTTQCQSNCTTGSGAQGVRVYVEPDDGERVITGAIKSARNEFGK